MPSATSGFLVRPLCQLKPLLPHPFHLPLTLIDSHLHALIPPFHSRPLPTCRYTFSLQQVQLSSFASDCMTVTCSFCLLHHVAAAAVVIAAAVGNRLGPTGAKALADALAPRQNPDGTWIHNNTLSTLGLFGAHSLPARSS